MRLFSIAALCVGSLLYMPTMASADIIAQWNFNTSTAPSSGSGSFSTQGGTTADLRANTGSSEAGGQVLRTRSYPAQGTANGTAGARFDSSTLGYNNISVTFDSMFSASAAKHQQFQYTTDGGATWIDFGGVYSATFGVWDNGRTYDLSSVAGVAFNSQFGARLVSVFGDGSNYLAAGNGLAGSYNNNGGFNTAIFYDVFTINGQAVPEPATMAVSGIAGIIGLAGFMRRKRKVAKA